MADFGDTIASDPVTGEDIVISRPTDLLVEARIQTAEYLNTVFNKAGEDKLDADDIKVLWVSPSLEEWRAVCDSELTEDFYEFRYNVRDGSSKLKIYSPASEVTATQIEDI